MTTKYFGTEYNYGGAGAYRTDKKSFAPCYESHKDIPVLSGVVRGGSCSKPKPGFDVYVGLDSGMHFLGKSWPWEPKTPGPDYEFLYKISDHCAPSDAKSFGQMVIWLVEQLKLGKRIHIGCIGGHGRTGTLLAAIITVATGNKDSIAWLRDNYCTKAVESASQVKFLGTQFGITAVKPSKPDYESYDYSVGREFGWKTVGKKSAITDATSGTDIDTGGVSLVTGCTVPIDSPLCVWGLDKAI